MRHHLLASVLAVLALGLLGGPSPAHADEVCGTDPAACQLSGCDGAYNVCWGGGACKGTVNVCPLSNDCKAGSVNVCRGTEEQG
jgi:hypothetical protein